MTTKIQHVASDMSTTPRNGQPWNFNGLLEVCLIPFSVAADKKLPPGARLLWGIIRQYSFEGGRCHASDETLARALAVSDRQVIRYIRVLETAGLLRSTPRPGRTPIRELLWDSRFAGKVRVRVDINVRGGRQIRQGGLTHPSALYKEEGVLNGVLNGKEAGDLKKPSPKDLELPPKKRGEEWTEADYIARGRACGFPEHIIQRDLERLRERKAKPTAERLQKADELKPELEAAIRR